MAEIEEMLSLGSFESEPADEPEYSISEDGSAITIDAVDEAMDIVQDFIRDRLMSYGCEKKAILQIRLAVEEIFINIISYAYRPEIGKAEVKCEVTDVPMTVTIQFMDSGRPFDPLAKEGAVGLFCRLYTIADAIDAFLADVYEPVANMSGRYTYIAGESTAGLVLYENGTFAYSHHATDPAFGKLVNAFDLVRIHKFPDVDPKQSFKNMADFVMNLPEIKILAAKERMTKAVEDFDDDEDAWLSQLAYDKCMAFAACI